MSEQFATINGDDTIKKQTTLFGLIAQSATTNRLFVMCNKIIKEQKIDGMMIPMNIRADDFYFTLSNMKHSHLSGAYIAQEYQEDAMEIVDELDEFAQVYGRCDCVVRKGSKLFGTYLGKNGAVEDELLAQEIVKKYKDV